MDEGGREGVIGSGLVGLGSIVQKGGGYQRKTKWVEAE